MFLKFRYRLGYESLCAEVSDSISWRRFCRIPLDGKVPHPTTLMKLTARCGEAAVAGLNEALLARAAGAKLLRTARVRTDTTVIPANVAYPTDSGLLARAVGKLVRTARAGAGRGRGPGHGDDGPAPGRGPAGPGDRQQAAHPRASCPGRRAPPVIRRVTGELAGLAEKTAAQAAAVLRNGRRALPRALSGRMRGRLRRALDELAVTIERTAAIVAQTRSRLAGQMPDSATRLVSLHDPDARPIRKGRIDRPAEFGYKAQVTDNDDGIVLDYSVEYGAAPDGPQLAPAVERIARRTGQRAPRGHRRPRLRPARRRARPARPGRPDRGDSPPGHDLTGPQGHRAQPRLPQARQVAHRVRRTDQLPQAQLRLGPHPPGRQERSRHLVRTRRLHPQPGQDQHPRRLTETPPTSPTRLKLALRLFQV